jgi:lipopolysaccharide/colanic/teichoic acid biosynthesis glycosyltransferase
MRPIILGEELFRDVLVKERKRADRSNQSVVLLLVTLNDGLGANSPSTWAPVIEALTDVAGDTDVVGWFEWRAAIGVILPDLPAFTPDDARGLETRIGNELARQSDVDTVGRVSIRLHVHPARNGALPFPDVPPQRGASIQAALKRMLDVVGSATLLVLFAPLLLLIAALVKLKSPGPVLFGQPRVGQRMQPFTMLKFRTMKVDVDARVHQEYVTQFIRAGSECGGADQFFKIKDDPRVTPVGRCLRRTSLDELPQLWNVLRGEMSLVGPRPPIAYELEQYKPWHYRRVFEAKPGITGLWQVTGRSRTTFDQMVRLDLQYARTSSLWTDIKILLATPAAVISGKGAC